MHRALLRSDIVSEIVKELYPNWELDEHSFQDLYSCAQVSKLWFIETVPIMWDVCDRNSPGVRNLAQIAQKDPSRAQLYADHIRFLNFGFFEDGEHYGPITFDTAYLDVLSQLSYPALECIGIYGTGEALDDRLVECYLQDRLESFSMEGEFCGHLETLLDKLSQRCPNIKNIDLECKGTLTVRLGSFLETCPPLNSFSLPPAHPSFSKRDFEAFFRMPELRQLGIPRIGTSWLDGKESIWPELDQLHTTLSSDAISPLTKAAPEIGILQLDLLSVPPPSDVFIKLSQLTHLRLLEVKLLNTNASNEPCINAQDLVIVAQNCPELFKFSVSGEKGHPSIHGITDAVFEELTKSLPEVSDFCLDVEDTEQLSFSALCALGKHCQQLWQARLSCNIDWTQDLETVLPADFQFTFAELGLVMRGERGPLERWTDADRERLSRFANRFVRSAIGLSEVDIVGGNDADEYVKEVLKTSIDRVDMEKYE